MSLATWYHFSAPLYILFTQVKFQQQYVKAILARQGVRLTNFDRFHSLSLKIIVDYPLLDPLLPYRAPGFLAVFVAVPLLISLIVASIASVPIFVAVPFLPLIG